jgi:GNAT superfamily N-acetyltransferase
MSSPDDSIVIRPLTDDDLPALRERIVEHQDYHRALEPQWPRGADRATKYLAHLPAECASCAGDIFLAVDGRTIAGFVCIVTDRRGAPDDPARHAFVHDLFVAQACRRRGMATRLMETAEAFGLSLGVSDVRLAVLDRNEDARAFYDALGFRGYRMGYGCYRRPNPGLHVKLTYVGARSRSG